MSAIRADGPAPGAGERSSAVRLRSAEDLDQGGDPPCWDGLVEDHRDRTSVPGRPTPPGGDLDSPAKVHDLVIAFYREIVFDPLLGPVFEEDAEVDWAAHIPHLIDYWCWILLGARRPTGNVTRTHRQLHDLHPLRAEHCERWFDLWCTCIDARWAGPTADRAKAYARTILTGLAKHVFEVAWPPDPAA
ncbi:MAG: group III truncated hemoglobin [Acidimicrobiales bacterium]